MGLSRKARICIKRFFAPFRGDRGLFLDDSRNPPAHLSKYFDVVRDFDGFTEYIESYGVPSLISMDHDLHVEHTMHFFEGPGWCGPCESGKTGFVHKTGHDCAVWLVDYCEREGKELGHVCIHSVNKEGAERIAGVIMDYQTSKMGFHLCKMVRWGIRDTRKK